MKAKRRNPTGRVIQAPGKCVLMNVACQDLLTNGGRCDVKFVAVIALPGGGAALRPLDLPPGTVSVVSLQDRRRVSVARVSGLTFGQKLMAHWNDAQERVEFLPIGPYPATVAASSPESAG